jgi:hypothetical protein
MPSAAFTALRCAAWSGSIQNEYSFRRRGLKACIYVEIRNESRSWRSLTSRLGLSRPRRDVKDGPELGGRDLQSDRQARDIDQGGISLAALNATEVSGMHTGPVRELFLRKAEPVAKLPHTPTESDPDPVHDTES